MANTYTIAVSDTNSGYIYDANYLHTDGIAFPLGNNALDSTTLQPIKIYDVAASGQSGSGLYQQIVVGATVTAGPYIFTDSGGTFSFRVGHTVSGSAMYYGRDSSYPTRNIYFGSGTGSVERSGQSLAGSLTYAFVPKAPPSAPTVVMNGLNATVTVIPYATNLYTTNVIGNGYSYVSFAHKVQYRTSTDNATWGAWGNTQTVNSSTLQYTYSGLTPGTYYQFRAFASNDVVTTGVLGGAASPTTAGVLSVGYGKRYDDSTSSFTEMTTGKRARTATITNIEPNYTAGTTRYTAPGHPFNTGSNEYISQISGVNPPELNVGFATNYGQQEGYWQLRNVTATTFELALTYGGSIPTYVSGGTAVKWEPMTTAKVYDLTRTNPADGSHWLPLT